ncbi:hypothetical protein H310_03808 [Aphanomyces invadans]|uniref:Lipase-like C-terminal domain-containing protein n=1 Tax=Aphanomyces invadans TaxID=157072 RepID=A0A024UG51_9STRA|nr:hypothetical protein H310_03808 [Aphanomyces invadans]ETW04613.1 hypothetical protein H310_03808 [Aphanomyces invadans]|eukprot:XP_008866051.1 hypothetical protein H310_03808 [Aphanomyces invadans]
MEATADPVVLIHGVFGWGNKSPLFNMLPNYWPVAELNRVNPNHIIVDVGKVSSDHDRACEAFYQLYGGQVDYGEAHSAENGHKRFGATYSKENAKHTRWSAENPVHLLGHSYGATTAIELYQLLCTDFFKVGSSHAWVKSIVCISGPLTGSTLCNAIGASLKGDLPVLGPGHIMVAGLGLMWKLQNFYFPWLKHIYDLDLGHWTNNTTWEMFYSTRSAVHTSRDLALYDLLPARRVQRNSQLVEMDKVHLLSIVTTATDQHHVPIREWVMAFGVVWLLFRRKRLWPTRSLRCALCLTLIAMTWRKLGKVDYSKVRSSLWGLIWVIRSYTSSMHKHDPLYNGFESAHWVHNDGVVNTYSQVYPRVEGPKCADSPALDRRPRSESHMSIDLEAENEVDNHTTQLIKGTWHTYRMGKNHLCGTHWDKEAHHLYTHLFKLLNKWVAQTTAADPAPR